MPPFAGNADDLEALVQLLRWERAGAPAQWSDPRTEAAAAPAAVQQWLDEAGTEAAP
jgi:cytochrome bd ubiquinol oxidase subunit I